MMIEVDLSEWEQQCCGDPFRIGSTVTWKLVARDPSEDSGRPLARYREEHHDQTPENVPHLPVTGTVRATQALHYAFDEGPNLGELTVRLGSEVAVELDAVPGAGRQLPGCTREHEVLAYRVQLEVAEDAELPAYVGDEQALLIPVIGSSTGASGQAPRGNARSYSGADVGEADTPQKAS